ncbi:MAG: hypothetical protein US43_C0035G0010 [Candidatus Levybacteria bacterium GW2011_GWA1_37_16]|nr:MAG: hypothetical protein US43_C0035G0010 [Candidatus Levybacteria bacterium GW2011_GWA1_37_16]
MDQDNQSDQEQKKQSGGGFNPINTFNNLMDIRRGFGKKAATQAGETAAKVLLVIVFAIVASGAAPGAPAMETGSINTQTEVPTPTLLPGP